MESLKAFASNVGGWAKVNPLLFATLHEKATLTAKVSPYWGTQGLQAFNNLKSVICAIESVRQAKGIKSSLSGEKGIDALVVAEMKDVEEHQLRAAKMLVPLVIPEYERLREALSDEDHQLLLSSMLNGYQGTEAQLNLALAAPLRAVYLAARLAGMASSEEELKSVHTHQMCHEVLLSWHEGLTALAVCGLPLLVVAAINRKKHLTDCMMGEGAPPDVDAMLVLTEALPVLVSRILNLKLTDTAASCKTALVSAFDAEDNALFRTVIEGLAEHLAQAKDHLWPKVNQSAVAWANFVVTLPLLAAVTPVGGKASEARSESSSNSNTNTPARAASAENSTAKNAVVTAVTAPSQPAASTPSKPTAAATGIAIPAAKTTLLEEASQLATKKNDEDELVCPSTTILRFIIESLVQCDLASGKVLQECFNALELLCDGDSSDYEMVLTSRRPVQGLVDLLGVGALVIRSNQSESGAMRRVVCDGRERLAALNQTVASGGKTGPSMALLASAGDADDDEPEWDVNAALSKELGVAAW